MIPFPRGRKRASRQKQPAVAARTYALCNHNDSAGNATPTKKSKSQAQAHDRVCTTPSPRGRTRAGRHGQSQASNRTRTTAALDDGRPAEKSCRPQIAEEHGNTTITLQLTHDPKKNAKIRLQCMARAARHPPLGEGYEQAGAATVEQEMGQEQ